MFEKNAIFFTSEESNTENTDIFYGRQWEKYWPFVLTHQDATQRCYSKKLSDKTYVVEDHLMLDGYSLSQLGFMIRLYVHEQGQMYRSITKTKTTKIFYPPEQYGSYYEYQISEIEVLRRRGDSKVPCNETIANEDEYFRDAVMYKVGCIPDYWKTFVSSSSSTRALSQKCNFTQYAEIKRILDTPMEKQSENIYLYPCVHMNVKIEQLSKEIGSDKFGNKLGANFGIKFHYRTKYELYKEITNHRSFTLETLFGQVGGFVGTG